MERRFYINHLVGLAILVNSWALLAFELSGIIKNYESRPSEHFIQIGCKFYHTNMELAHRFPYDMCKEVFYEESYLYFFKKKVKYWLVQEGSNLARLNSKGEIVWSNIASYNHDYAFDSESEFTDAIVEDFYEKNGKKYIYFRIETYDQMGRPIHTWRATDHLDELYKIGKWKSFENGLKAPLTARTKVRSAILNANFLTRLESAWQVGGGGPLLAAGTLMAHVRYLNTLIAFDRDYKIIWSYEFNPTVKDSEHSDIHTPVFLKNGEIAVFHNSIQVEGGFRSGVAFFDSSMPGTFRTFFLVPRLYAGQEKENGAFGSIQILEDDSIFLSTGSEYGGVIHIDKYGQVLFHWINSETAPSAETGKVLPKPIYRSELVEESILNGVNYFR